VPDAPSSLIELLLPGKRQRRKGKPPLLPLPRHAVGSAFTASTTSRREASSGNILMVLPRWPTTLVAGVTAVTGEWAAMNLRKNRGQLVTSNPAADPGTCCSEQRE
jgi:hypothetical protein